MTTTPEEPLEDPELTPSGDPDPSPGPATPEPSRPGPDPTPTLPEELEVTQPEVQPL
ncbi:MAG: hypothetical protein WB767_04165 [Nocardioides sp.]